MRWAPLLLRSLSSLVVYGATCSTAVLLRCVVGGVLSFRKLAWATRQVGASCSPRKFSCVRSRRCDHCHVISIVPFSVFVSSSRAYVIRQPQLRIRSSPRAFVNLSLKDMATQVHSDLPNKFSRLEILRSFLEVPLKRWPPSLRAVKCHLSRERRFLEFPISNLTAVALAQLTMSVTMGLVLADILSMLGCSVF